MKVLVTGGAGYIGSHIVKLLGEKGGYEITVLDNLSTGFKKSVLYGNFIEADLSDFKRVEEIISHGGFDSVIHFAAHIVVPESVEDPIKYYMNNTVNTANLIKLCVKYKVNKFIFSSTAAVYGEPEVGKVNELSQLAPINPYGMSKLMSERILQDCCKYDNFRFVILRYFNVAGADPDQKIGQNFLNATHLIKIAAQTALGLKKKMMIFGDDFPTFDGTGIRDYIHVSDLAAAHLAALEYLQKGGAPDIFNCGYGHGYSVKQVVAAMKKVSGVDFTVETTGRRAGDPAMLIADNSKIFSTLQWKPRHDDLEFICRTALDWETKLNK